MGFLERSIRAGDQKFVDLAYLILRGIWQVEIPQWLGQSLELGNGTSSGPGQSVNVGRSGGGQMPVEEFKLERVAAAYRGPFGPRLVLDDDYLTCQGAVGFRVLRAQIDAVVIDNVQGLGWFKKGTLKVIGRGTTLASIEWNLPWIEAAYAWLAERLNT